MQVEMKNGKLQQVSREVAETLIAAGLATEVKPAVDKPRPNLTFSTGRGPVQGDYEYPPAIHHYCSTCGLKGYTASQKGTAHESVEIRHCGIAERPGPQVAGEYLRLFEQWKSRSRKLPAPKISSADTRFLSAFGLKTKEELIVEAQADLIMPRGR